MNYEPTKEEIDLIRALLNDKGQGFWADKLIIGTLKQTKIFHILSAIKVLKIKDDENWQFPILEEIEEKLTQLLEETKKLVSSD